MSKTTHWAPAGAGLLLASLGLGMGGCDYSMQHHARANAASPSAQLIGTAPAPPSADSVPANGTVVLRETPETTPVSKDEDELSKKDETHNMPLEGQPNSHSTVASDASQRAGQTDAQQQPERTAEPSPAPEQRTAPPST